MVIAFAVGCLGYYVYRWLSQLMHLLLTVSLIAWLSNWLLRLLFAVMVIAFVVCCLGYCVCCLLSWLLRLLLTFLTVAFAVCCLVYCVCCW